MMRLQILPSASFLTLSVAVFLSYLAVATAEKCFANDSLNTIFETEEPTCCQFDVCGLPCPAPVSKPTVGTSSFLSNPLSFFSKSFRQSPLLAFCLSVCKLHVRETKTKTDPSHPFLSVYLGFGIGLIVAIVISFLIGVATLFLVQGEAENFFVAGRSLPLWIVVFTLAAQSIDSNALLGNADLSYKFHFYDGAVLPIGLGLSLILNGLFLARHINAERGVLTLPDVLAKRYGKLVEVLVSLATIVSFMMLLAGNLVGMGVILSYILGFSTATGIWISAAVVWAYTVSGGLFSVAYTDVAQGLMGWSGCIVLAYYLISNETRAPPPSIGFPGYVYPDAIGDDGVCDMYQGVSCENDATQCCYNADLWCPSDDNCRADNGAYPIGDQPIFSNQMFDHLALTPFPNAIFWNWATIFILGFGNLAALDFQARCMAAKTPGIATWGCIIAGCLTFFVGIPFAYLGAITR